jgi:hypothetical protein
MEEASGFCGLIILILAIVLLIASYRSLQREPAAAGVAGVAVAGDDPEPGEVFSWWPIGARVTMVTIGLLYAAGLFLIRPHAMHAKRRGSSPQQAAFFALSLFAMSPIVVPARAAWYALGALGQALTSSPDDDEGKGKKPFSGRGLDDI